MEPDEFHLDTVHAVSHGPCLHLPKKRHRGETAGEAGGNGEGRWEGQRELGCREEKGCDRYSGRREQRVEHELRRLKNPREHGGDTWVREGRVKSEVRTERWKMNEATKGELG